MNANNPDQSRGKKGSSGWSNRTGDKERIIDNNHNKKTSQVDHIGTQQNDIDINLEIQDVEGIGPTTAKKLKEAGIISVMELAVTTPEQLAVDIISSKDSAAAFIMAAQKLLRESHILE